ncbi:MAG: rod shape-determining protein MreC [Chloroherpetonaceae bacterium]|nr:rod shape-determining protein MreC [Chloroherpetonaceae bacterium]MDW8437032.1 rod shape-determining protein MreC [Chloroherpetonaceae bacterium]
MRQLFDFLVYDFRQYILLAIFCLVSIALLVNRDTPALRVIRGASIELFGAIETPLKAWTRYFGLREENAALLAANVALSAEASRMRAALAENEKLRAMLNCKAQTPRKLLFAHVVDRTFHPERNLFLIDAGSDDGVEVGMAVLTDKGLAGRIALTSPHFAIVQPVINSDFKVSVISEKNRSLGVAHWTGGDIERARLLHVPTSRKLDVGERILTTEFSSFANANIVVGEVESIEFSAQDLFQRVVIRLAVDFGALEHVFVDLEKPNAEQELLRARYKEFQ